MCGRTVSCLHQDTRPVTQILITGASGGLGAALARHYAVPGIVLLLWGRDAARLATVADACRAAGAGVRIRSLDLVDTRAMLTALAEEGAIDLALLVAGSGKTQTPDDLAEDPVQVARTGAINFVATTALAAALARGMAARGAGRIVLVGSAAAFHALPFAAAYAGSKAGLAQFAAALRIGVRRYGVRVVLVSPGFIATKTVRSPGEARPCEIAPADAAARIARAAVRGPGHVVFPWPFVVLRWIDRLLPPPLRERLLLALARKH